MTTAAIFAAGVFIGSLTGLIVGLMIGARRRAEPECTGPRVYTSMRGGSVRLQAHPLGSIKSPPPPARDD